MANEIDKTDALQSLSPSADWVVRGGVVEWIGGGTEPTTSAIDAEVIRLQAQEYARNREAEYPTIAELTVALYDTDDKADIEAKRAEVKKKYPKP